MYLIIHYDAVTILTNLVNSHTLKQYFHVEKIMRIHKNGPLDKFMLFLF